MSAALEKTLKAISIPLSSSVGAFDGSEGLIPVYHTDGWIDLFYRNIEQPQWDPLLAFIHETTERSCRPRRLRCRKTSWTIPRQRIPSLRRAIERHLQDEQYAQLTKARVPLRRGPQNCWPLHP